jgi:hypothetical protein
MALQQGCISRPNSRERIETAKVAINTHGNKGISRPNSREQIETPKWAKEAVAAGTPLAGLIRPDGFGLISKADASKLGLVVERGAFEIAKTGGHYAKFYERYKNEYSTRLERAVKSYGDVIAEHEARIKNPAIKLEPDASAEGPSSATRETNGRGTSPEMLPIKPLSKALLRKEKNERTD